MRASASKMRATSAGSVTWVMRPHIDGSSWRLSSQYPTSGSLAPPGAAASARVAAMVGFRVVRGGSGPSVRFGASGERPYSGTMSSLPEAHPPADRKPGRGRPFELQPTWRMSLWHGAIIAGLLFLAYIFLVVAPREGIFGMDAWAYWNVEQPDVYAVPLSGFGAFTYSPPAALVADLFDAVPWNTFIWLWTALLVATLIFIGGSGAWILAAFAFPPVALELLYGNIHILLAVAVALGFRYPWTWTFVLLTKPTCGIGLLWFLLRGEWRQLAMATLPAMVISAVTFIFVPTLWHDWIDFLRESPLVLHKQGAIAIPLVPAPGRRGAARHVGRTDEPPLDGRGRGDAGAADPLDRRSGHARGRHPRVARALTGQGHPQAPQSAPSAVSALES